MTEEQESVYVYNWYFLLDDTHSIYNQYNKFVYKW